MLLLPAAVESRDVLLVVNGERLPLRSTKKIRCLVPSLLLLDVTKYQQIPSQVREASLGSRLLAIVLNKQRPAARKETKQFQSDDNLNTRRHSELGRFRRVLLVVWTPLPQQSGCSPEKNVKVACTPVFAARNAPIRGRICCTPELNVAPPARLREDFLSDRTGGEEQIDLVGRVGSWRVVMVVISKTY